METQYILMRAENLDEDNNLVIGNEAKYFTTYESINNQFNRLIDYINKARKNTKYYWYHVRGYVEKYAIIVIKPGCFNIIPLSSALNVIKINGIIDGKEYTFSGFEIIYDDIKKLSIVNKFVSKLNEILLDAERNNTIIIENDKKKEMIYKYLDPIVNKLEFDTLSMIDNIKYDRVIKILNGDEEFKEIGTIAIGFLVNVEINLQIPFILKNYMYVGGVLSEEKVREKYSEIGKKIAKQFPDGTEVYCKVIDLGNSDDIIILNEFSKWGKMANKIVKNMIKEENKND